MIFQDVLEVIQVGCFLHAALQAVDLFTNLRVHRMGGSSAVGMTGAGGLQVALEGFQAFVEPLQIGFEFVLATVRDCQHQSRQIVEDRQQFVPVQTVFQSFPHGFGLRAMTLGQRQVIEQA
ncbi:hypothetical protein D9M73_273350 [compost metagenome]